MTDRKRLIEILKLGSCPSPYLCDDNCKYANLERCYEERTADLLLDHGVIVLPCKLGDTVCIVYDGVCEEYIVTQFCCDTLGIFKVCAECNIHGKNNIFQCDKYCCGRNHCRTSFEFSDIGKTVFLSREEAEKALKERENNDLS